MSFLSVKLVILLVILYNPIENLCWRHQVEIPPVNSEVTLLIWGRLQLIQRLCTRISLKRHGRTARDLKVANCATSPSFCLRLSSWAWFWREECYLELVGGWQSCYVHVVPWSCNVILFITWSCSRRIIGLRWWNHVKSLTCMFRPAFATKFERLCFWRRHYPTQSTGPDLILIWIHFYHESMEEDKYHTGWWFGTFFFLHILGIIIPTD